MSCMGTECECQHCGRRLSRPDNLNRHIERLHPGEWLKDRSPALKRYERNLSIMKDRLDGAAVRELAVKYDLCVRMIEYVLAAPADVDSRLLRAHRNLSILHEWFDMHLTQGEIAARHGVSPRTVRRILSP